MTESIQKLQQVYLNHCDKYKSKSCSDGECGLGDELCQAIGDVLREYAGD